MKCIFLSAIAVLATSQASVKQAAAQNADYLYGWDTGNFTLEKDLDPKNVDSCLPFRNACEMTWWNEKGSPYENLAICPVDGGTGKQPRWRGYELFKDSGCVYNPGELFRYKYTLASKTVEECVRTCLKNTTIDYAALTSTKCYCARKNSLTKPDNYEEKCSDRCPGNEKQACGGTSGVFTTYIYASLYEIVNRPVQLQKCLNSSKCVKNATTDCDPEAKGKNDEPTNENNNQTQTEAEDNETVETKSKPSVTVTKKAISKPSVTETKEAKPKPSVSDTKPRPTENPTKPGTATGLNVSLKVLVLTCVAAVAATL